MIYAALLISKAAFPDLCSCGSRRLMQPLLQLNLAYFRAEEPEVRETNRSSLSQFCLGLAPTTFERELLFVFPLILTLKYWGIKPTCPITF